MISQVPSAPVGAPKKPWTILALLTAIIAGGIALVEVLKQTPSFFPDPGNWFNAFFVVTAATEPAGLWIALVFCLLMAIFWLGKTAAREKKALGIGVHPRGVIIGLAIFSLALSTAGAWLFAHHYPLSADEKMPDFQGRIFLSGKLRAPIPPGLLFASPWLKPIFTARSPDGTSWNQAYLPVYAALRTPFLALRVEALLNPFLGVVTVFAMAGVVRLIWPTKPWLTVTGAAFVAFSPQVLLNDMTSYAMPAHLALNTVWLWLWLQPDKRRFWLAPVVGVLAMGLHSPFVHALFATPFLVRLLAERRWRIALGCCFIYLAGSAIWLEWWATFAPSNVSGATKTGSLLAIDFENFLRVQPLNLLNLITWNALPVALLAFLGLGHYRRLPVPARDAALSCLLTFFFYLIVPFDQGFGWGNRYFHGTLSCLFLLAVAGFDQWSAAASPVPARFVVTGFALTVLLSVPLRCWQMEKFVRPFASAAASFRALPVDLVVFDPQQAWYSSNLLQNSPTLDNQPLILSLRRMDSDIANRLQKKFPRIHVVTREELAGYGLSTTFAPTR